MSLPNSSNITEIPLQSLTESFPHFVQTFSSVSKMTIGKVSEDNNNLLQGINRVELLELRNTDNEDQYSNSSSLESRNSLTNHQGSREGDGESGSTSCSEDSFEMSSTCSVRDETSEGKNDADPRVSSFSKTSSFKNRSNNLLNHFYDAHNLINYNEHLQQIRRNVADQIEHIDTGLPKLDFVKLEEQLATAAREREEVEKKMVISQSASREKEGDNWRQHTSFQKYKKVNTVLRLPPNKNLQVCFMNELSETDTNEEESEDSDFEHSYIRKTKSVPNIKSVSNADVLDTRSLEELIEKLEKNTLNDNDRCKILKNEAHRVIKIAEERAKTTLAEYRSGKSKASDVPRQARQYLSKTKLADIQIIHRQIEEAINRKNNELVGLLLQRDNLHMEHDSLRVDIDDYTQQKSPLIFLDMKQLLHLQNGLEEKLLQAKNQSSITFFGY